MNYRILLCLLFIIAGIESSCYSQHYLMYYYERVIRLGDDPSWADPELNHEDWDYSGSTDTIGNFWVRFKIQCDTFTDTFENAGMQVTSLGAYEVYWDGQLIGGSGKVGHSKEEEIPGQFLSQVYVPDSLLAHGEHVVAFRVSNYHSPSFTSFSWNTFHLEEYMYSLRTDLVLAAKLFILAGLYLMAALFYLFLYVLRKRETVGLIFSVMCFLFFGLIFMEYYKILYAYPYPFHFYRLYIIFGLTYAITFLTPLFLLLYFKFPYSKLIAALIFCLQLLICFIFNPGNDATNSNLSMLMWYTSSAIVLYAIYLKRKESWVILGTLSLIGMVIWFNTTAYRASLYTYDINLFICFSILVVSMMYLLAKRSREQRQAYEASLLLSSRLQNELLKKNIQPHFIMNTLTSLMEWIEESPKESVHFIEALSREFEIVSEIAEKQLIPIEQEIALCQHHIKIMKFRKEVDYSLECENIQSDESIPPAIFHTIIENGITHSLPDDNNQIKMVLNFTETKEYKCYQLSTFARNRKASEKREGTGLKYVKSRLEENYGSRWKLESEPGDFGWVTRVYIFK